MAPASLRPSAAVPAAVAAQNSRLTLPSSLNAARVLTASAASDSAPALSQVARARSSFR